MSAKHSFSGLVEREPESFTPAHAATSADGLERNREPSGTVPASIAGSSSTACRSRARVRHDDNDSFDDFTTWRASASLMLKSVGLRPHASIGTEWRCPACSSSSDRCSATFIGNPNLQPEESLGWDAGVEFTLIRNRAFLDLTYFRTNLTNKIDGSGLAGSSLINLAGESKREGVGCGAAHPAVPWLYAGASLHLS